MLKKFYNRNYLIVLLMYLYSIVLLFQTYSVYAWTKTGLPSNKTEAVSIGGICRNEAIKKKFDIMMGYPNSRKGYKVDHICALAEGGMDIIENMQYQTTADAHVKDLIENTDKGKLLYCNPTNSTPTRKVYNCK